MAKRKPGEIDRVLGRRIRDRRTAVGRKPEEIAKAIDVSTEAYRKYETGQTAIDAIQLIMICRLLGLHPADLIAPLLPLLDTRPGFSDDVQAGYDTDAGFHAVRAALLAEFERWLALGAGPEACREVLRAFRAANRGDRLVLAIGGDPETTADS